MGAWIADNRPPIFRCRHFNRLVPSPVAGRLIKTSRDEAKLRQEIEWYLHLPSDLQHLIPRIFSFDATPGQCYLELEYVPHLDLGILLQTDRLPPAKIDRAVRGLLGVVELLAQRTCPASRTSRINAAHSMYVEKTRHRLAKCFDAPSFRDLARAELIIDGVRYPPLEVVLGKVVNGLSGSTVPSVPELGILHGDLCFSNVLWNDAEERFVLVDPRGSFGAFGLYGDYRYDLAKLSHSALGGYDSLVADKFVIRSARSGFDCEVVQSVSQSYAANVFHEVMREKDCAIQESVSLLEAALFISMLPLHRDSRERQLAIIAQALRCYGRTSIAEE